MKLFAILVFVFCTFSVNANEYVQSSRYVEIDISPQSQQIDPLQVVIDFTFPQGIKTVGEAIYLLISPSGYQLELSENDIAYVLFEMPLPEVHRHLGPIRFKDAVSILSGKGFIPHFDETMRNISFVTHSDSIKSVDISPYKTLWEARKNHVIPVIKSPTIEGAGGDKYEEYTVLKGDSVSIIAGKLSLPFNDKFLNFVVQANPHAFINADPDKLISDITIKVPSL